MPTGYTEIIETDPNATLSDYVWRCAKAILGPQDDTSSSPYAPLHVPFDGSAYLADMQARGEDLILLLQMSEEDKIRGAEDFNTRTAHEVVQYNEEKAALRRQYDRMAVLLNEKEKTVSQRPNPSSVDISGVFRFARDQIKLSRPYAPQEPPPALSPEEWFQRSRDGLIEEIRHLRDQHDRARDRTHQRNEAAAALHAHIPHPISTKEP